MTRISQMFLLRSEAESSADFQSAVSQNFILLGDRTCQRTRASSGAMQIGKHQPPTFREIRNSKPETRRKIRRKIETRKESDRGLPGFHGYLRRTHAAESSADFQSAVSQNFILLTYQTCRPAQVGSGALQIGKHQPPTFKPQRNPNSQI